LQAIPPLRLLCKNRCNSSKNHASKKPLSCFLRQLQLFHSPLSALKINVVGAGSNDPRRHNFFCAFASHTSIISSRRLRLCAFGAILSPPPPPAGEPPSNIIGKSLQTKQPVKKQAQACARIRSHTRSIAAWLCFAGFLKQSLITIHHENVTIHHDFQAMDKIQTLMSCLSAWSVNRRFTIRHSRMAAVVQIIKSGTHQH